MKSNVNMDVTVSQIHRIQVTSYSNPWHRDLLDVIAAHYRCVVVNKGGALWIAGANRTKALECRKQFKVTLTALRAAAREVGCADRDETLDFYAGSLEAIAAGLKRRHLPELTKSYAERKLAA
jgi:hypothetical protein